MTVEAWRDSSLEIDKDSAALLAATKMKTTKTKWKYILNQESISCWTYTRKDEPKSSGGLEIYRSGMLSLSDVNCSYVISWRAVCQVSDDKERLTTHWCAKGRALAGLLESGWDTRKKQTLKMKPWVLCLRERWTRLTSANFRLSMKNWIHWWQMHCL